MDVTLKAENTYSMRKYQIAFNYVGTSKVLNRSNDCLRKNEHGFVALAISQSNRLAYEWLKNFPLVF